MGARGREFGSPVLQRLFPFLAFLLQQISLKRGTFAFLRKRALLPMTAYQASSEFTSLPHRMSSFKTEYWASKPNVELQNRILSFKTECWASIQTRVLSIKTDCRASKPNVEFQNRVLSFKTECWVSKPSVQHQNRMLSWMLMAVFMSVAGADPALNSDRL